MMVVVDISLQSFDMDTDILLLVASCAGTPACEGDVVALIRLLIGEQT